MACVNWHPEQDFTELKLVCTFNGVLFQDTKFTPSNESLFKLIKRPNVVWKRPFEIVDDPKFIIDLHAEYLESIDNR